MKKIILLIGIIVSLLSITKVCYARETADGLYNFETSYDENNIKYVMIQHYNGDATDVVIPATIDVSFSQDGSMPTVVRKIGGGQRGAFQWNHTVESIVIPSSVKYIDGGTFNGCSSLTSITIPEGVISIGGRAFAGCTNLVNILIPSTVTNLERSAFDECSSLENINIDENNILYKSINGIVFTKDGSKIVSYPEGKKDTSYIIPVDVTTIGVKSFYNSQYLENIIIPNKITTIEDGAFSYSKKLNNVLVPENVASIGSGAFYQCHRLYKLTIFNRTADLGRYLYSGSNSVVIYCYENSTAHAYVMANADGSNRSWHRLPEVKNDIPDQEGAIGKEFNYIVPDDTFNLFYAYTYTYSVRELPDGIIFDFDTKTFSGTPTKEGTYKIRLRITESGNSVSEEFNIIINKEDKEPLVANEIPDQVSKVGEDFRYEVPENTFGNIDETYVYSASGMPEGITFNEETKVFEGIAIVSDLYMIRVTVTKENKSVSEEFNIIVNEEDKAPVLANEIPDQVAISGEEFKYIIPLNTFEDENKETLIYSMTTTADNITFDANKREVKLETTTADIISIKIKATNEKNKSVFDIFNISVTKKNTDNGSSSSSSSSGSSSSRKEVKDTEIIPVSKKGIDKKITIKQENIIVEFNGLAFKELKNKKVQAKIRKIKQENLKIDKKLKEQIGDLPIFDISIYANGKKQHFESEEPIVIKIPLNTKKENHKVIAVYIDENGKTKVMNGILKNRIMTFSTNHLSNYALIYVDKSFDDIKNHWSKEAVESLAARNIVNGKTNEYFKPESNITRAEFITIMVRFFELESDQKLNIKENIENEWYAEYFEVAKSNNILPEIYNDNFNGDKEIKREEMMYILYKSLEITNKLDMLEDTKDELSDFEDVKMISDYAINSSKYLVAKDIINGDENKINPKNTSTRAEVVQMTWNLISNLNK